MSDLGCYKGLVDGCAKWKVGKGQSRCRDSSWGEPWAAAIQARGHGGLDKPTAEGVLRRAWHLNIFEVTAHRMC